MHTKTCTYVRINRNVIPVSVDGWSCSLPAIYLGPNYSGGNEDNGDLPQKIPSMYRYTPCPQPCSRPPPTQAFAGDSRTHTGKSPVGSLFLSPGSWCRSFVVPSKSLFPSPTLMATSSKRIYAILCPTTTWVLVADYCPPVPP